MLWRRTGWRAAAVVVLLVALLACGEEGGQRYGSPLARHDLSGAQFWLHVPSLAQLRDDLLTLIVNMDGMEGVLTLVRSATGVDLAAEGLLGEAGLSETGEGLLFRSAEGWALSFTVAAPDQLARYLAGLAGRLGLVTATVVTSDGPHLHTLGERSAWVVEGDLATVLFWSAGDPAAGLARLLVRPPPAPEAMKLQEAAAGGGYRFKVAGLRGLVPTARNGELLAASGMAAGVVRELLRFVGDCSELDGRLRLGDRVVLQLAAPGCRWPEGGGTMTLFPERLVAEDTVALVHARLGGSSLWDSLPQLGRFLLASWWRERFTRELPEQAELAAWLDRFEPEVALAFLGFSGESNLGMFTRAGGVGAILSGLHLVVALPVREGRRVGELLDPAVVEKVLPGFQPRGIGAGEVAGTEWCHESKEGTACFSLLDRGNVLLAVTGRGEGERLVRTVRGQARALDEALFAQRTKGALTFTFKSRRLVGDLMSKGFPPYFLAVLSSVLEARLAISPTDGGTGIELELVMR